jgi:hypothetical protein
MECNNFSIEIYHLYTLGVLEGDERSQVEGHIRQKCAQCLSALRDGMEFWFLYGILTEQLQQMALAGPSQKLRRRLLVSINPSRRRPPIIPIWTWSRTAAAAVFVFGSAMGSWQMSRILAQTQKHRIEVELANATRNAQNLAVENLRIRSALDESIGRLNRRQSEAPERVKPDTPNGTAAEALSRDLNEARLSAASSAESLAKARAQIDELRAQISLNNGLLTAANQQREETERRYKTALEQNLRERDVEVAAYKTRIRQVETEIVQYRQMVDALGKRLNQHLLMASMLRSPTVALVRLRATEAGGAAMANALIDERSKLMFYAWNLPALPPGKTFQVWLIRGRGPAIVSAGTFNGGVGEGAVLQFNRADLLADITGVAVTEEPAGGSPLPTGHKLLIGMLRG